MPCRSDAGQDLMRRIMDNETKLDQMQLDIDKEAIRLLTVYSPVAGDLRLIMSVSASPPSWSGSVTMR